MSRLLHPMLWSPSASRLHRENASPSAPPCQHLFPSSWSLSPSILAQPPHPTFPEGFLSDMGFPPVHCWMLVLLFPLQLSLFCRLTVFSCLFPGCLSPFLPLIVCCSPIPAAAASLPPLTFGLWGRPLPPCSLHPVSRWSAGIAYRGMCSIFWEFNNQTHLGNGTEMSKSSWYVVDTHDLMSNSSPPKSPRDECAGAAAWKDWLLLACVGGWSFLP